MTTSRNTSSPRLFLMGWDAADWQVINPLIDAGELPNLQKLVERGVMGDIRTLKPVLSPMLWNSIATGKRADQHGILGFTEVDETMGRMVPSASTSRKCKALWNITSQNKLNTNVVSWFASHPAEPIRGNCISEMLSKGIPSTPEQKWPLPADTFHPPELEKRVNEWRLHPSEIDQNLLSLFVPKWTEVDQEKDQSLSVLAQLLAEVFTTHAATMELVKKNDWDFMASYYISIDHFCHSFMHYHPPKLEGVDETKYELYKDVINSIYRLHDLLLGAIVEAAGDDCYFMLTSDHGFRSDHLRPSSSPDVPGGPAEWHRDQGIFCFAGPGIRQDEIIHGATLLDIAPTILHSLGIPIGRDMDGKVLTTCWEKDQNPEYVDSWENIPGEDGMHPHGTTPLELSDRDLLMEQFVALGYIEKPSEDNDTNIEKAKREQDWNLAQVYLEKSQIGKAIPLIESVYQGVQTDQQMALAETAISRTPDAPDHAQVHIDPRPEVTFTLTQCYLAIGDLTSAQSILDPILNSPSPSVKALVIGGKLYLAQGKPREALDRFREAESKLVGNAPAIAHEMGLAYEKLRRWDSAIECHRRALEWNPGHAGARLQLGFNLLQKRKFEEAADEALAAISNNFEQTFAHVILGKALTHIPGETERAEQAFKVALTQQPGNWAVHQALMSFYKKSGTHQEQADHHKAEMRRLITQQKEELKKIETESRERQKNAKQNTETINQQAAEAARLRKNSKEFLIVSGLPRSGTSLMMGMLQAGGIAPLTDDIRKADDDNPTGYFEWEAVKKLVKQPSLIEHANGKALKVVSPWLVKLPKYHRFRVIFMLRPIEEVWSSQSVMKDNRGTKTPENQKEKAIELMEAHRDQVLWSLHKSPRFEVLEVEFPKLINTPQEEIETIRNFLGQDLDLEAMAGFIRPELYRHRQPKE